jgi:hypothetical protein
MARNTAYDGLTYFSAAHVAGLLLQPVDWAQAETRGRQLCWNPGLPATEARRQVIHQIALRRAAGPEGGTVAEYEQQLDAQLLAA